MPLTHLHEELQRLLRELALLLESSHPEDGSFRPSLDVLADDEVVELRAELAGLDPDEIEVLVEGSTLVLRGNKRAEPPAAEERLHFHRLERQQGSFERRIRLPEALDLRRADARLERGVLRITMPRIDDRRQSSWKVEIIDGDEDS